MSKLFTEFSVQQNICPLPKMLAKNSNVLWLSFSCDNMLSRLMCLPRTALARHRAVSVLHPPNPLTCIGPVTTPENTAQHTVLQHQHWQISASAVCSVTTAAPVRPCQGSGRAGSRVPGMCHCPPEPRPCPELTQGLVPLLLRLLLTQRLPEGDGLQEAPPMTSAAEGNSTSNAGEGRGANTGRII